MTLGVARARKNIASARKCNELSMRSRHRFRISFHHVFSHAGNAGNVCSDSAASLGLRGLVSDTNVQNFLAGKAVLCAGLFFDIPHRLTQTRMQLGVTFDFFQLFFLRCLRGPFRSLSSEALCFAQSACWDFE